MWSCALSSLLAPPRGDCLQAVNGVAFATFVASGQTCIMGARVLVHEDVYDRFMAALVEKASTLHICTSAEQSRVVMQG